MPIDVNHSSTSTGVRRTPHSRQNTSHSAQTGLDIAARSFARLGHYTNRPIRGRGTWSAGSDSPMLVYWCWIEGCLLPLPTPRADCLGVSVLDDEGVIRAWEVMEAQVGSGLVPSTDTR